MKPSLWYRLRGLQKMEKRFGKHRIRDFISKRLQTEPLVRILEIGFGEGKCLLELRKVFPTSLVELYGVNIKKEGNMHSRADFITNARRFKLPLPPRKILPKPFFFDAGKRFPFPSSAFDCIISQVAAPYVGNKAKLIEEVWRVLKPGGRAFIHLDTYELEYPDFMQMNTETPRFLIYQSGRMRKLSEILHHLQKQGYDIRLKSGIYWKYNRILTMTKSIPAPLRLHLLWDRRSSFSRIKVRETHSGKGYLKNPWWGMRSVFKNKC